MIILASASPRRQEILKTAGYEYRVKPMDIDEEKITAPTRQELAKKLAESKAEACYEALGRLDAGDCIVAADTLVYKDDIRMGKPASIEKWREYIKMLQGGTHEVITGVCIISENKKTEFYSSTEVTVDAMSDEQIDEFISRGEDMDKAGGYAIQGFFGRYITEIKGEYNNVVGFPVAAFRQNMEKIHSNVLITDNGVSL